jgi:predicted porin
MKKSLVALAALSAIAGAAQAQSSVVLYGVVDASIRSIDNAGADNNSRLNYLGGPGTHSTAGGMTPSRWGIRVTEDLGGGYRGIANIESRFNPDNGNQQVANFFQQSWVGLVTPFGQLTLGRQYNVLFDVQTFAYSPFKTMGPYLESYKPEIGMQMGARNSNMVKYAIALGGFAAELQASAGEGTIVNDAPGNTTGGTYSNGKSLGGMLRYKFGDITVGGGYLEREIGGTDAKAKGGNVGIGYDNGKLYLNAFYARTDIDDELALPPALGGRVAGPIVLYAGQGPDNGILAAGGAAPSGVGAKERDMYSVGGTYLVTNALNVGLQYWRMEQDGASPFLPADGDVDYFAVAAQYSFSKRSSVYTIVDHTKTGGDLTLQRQPGSAGPGPDSRTGITVGILHRF